MSFRNLSGSFLILSIIAAPLGGAGCTNLPGLGGQGTPTGAATGAGAGSTAGGQVGEQAATLAGQSTADEVPYAGGEIGGIVGRQAGSHIGGQADK